jgi:hypothetical protein
MTRSREKNLGEEELRQLDTLFMSAPKIALKFKHGIPKPVKK